jgi:hypothetical protein
MNERLPSCILGAPGKGQEEKREGGRDADRTSRSEGRVGCCARDSGWAWFGEGAE